MESVFSSASSPNDYKALLEAGHDVGRVEDPLGGTAIFHLANWREHDNLETYLAVAALLKAAGANVNHIDSGGCTALLRCDNDNVGVALLTHGADVFVESNGVRRSALVYSALRGQVSTIRYIVDVRKVDVNRRVNGRTPLHHVCCEFFHANYDQSHKNGLEALIACGAEVDRRDAAGRTPLYSVLHSVECAGILVAAGADVNALVYSPNGKGWELPLHGVHERSSQVLRLLIQNGAMVNAQDSLGNTPLMRLMNLAGGVRQVRHDVFFVLWSAGASCRPVNKRGERVLDMRLAKMSPYYREMIDNRFRYENFARRRPMLLILYKGGNSSPNTAIEMLCKIGFWSATGANTNFMRNIVEYM